MNAKRNKLLEAVAFEYDLAQIPDITIIHTAFTAVVKLSGKIKLQSMQGYDLVAVTKDTFVLKCKEETDTALGSLMSGMEVDFTRSSNRTVFSNNLTARMGYAGGVQTAMSIGANPPRFKAANTFPAKTSVITPDSSLGQYKCEVGGFNVGVEITPHPPVMKPEPKTVPHQVPVATKDKRFVIPLNAMVTLAATAILTGILARYAPLLTPYLKAMSTGSGLILPSTQSIMINGKITVDEA